MSFDRRSFFALFGLLVAFPGCLNRNDSVATVRKIELILLNSRPQANMFHVALESTDGLGAWRSYEVAAEERERVTIEPDPEREWVACHGFVNDQQARQELAGVEDNDEACLKLTFYNAGFTGEGDAGMLQAMEFGC